ncbi:MAG: hypothetical protein HY996_12140 [Micrococcales bacterium]|nr:hypothetical protein [Micrococcales bacterium]
MDPRTAAIEEALRLAHSAIQATEGMTVPEVEPDTWSGPAARVAADALRDLAGRLAGCRSRAADSLAAARRAAADV